MKEAGGEFLGLRGLRKELMCVLQGGGRPDSRGCFVIRGEGRKGVRRVIERSEGVFRPQEVRERVNACF